MNQNIISYCGLTRITEGRPQFKESCHVQALSKAGFAIAKKVHGVRLDWSSGPDTRHLIEFIHADDLARAALRNIEKASTRRAVVHAGRLGGLLRV